MRRPILLTIACTLSLLSACGDRPSAEPVAAPTDPRAIDTPPPVYAMELACAGIDGVVELQLTIGVDGKVSGARLERGSGNAQLDQAATAAVKDWRFEPATRGGRPVETRIRVPVTFTAPEERPQACFALDAGRPVAG